MTRTTMTRRPAPAHLLLLVGAWTLATVAGAQGGLGAAASMDGVAVLSEGPRVSLRWSLPGEVFPPGGFVLTRIAPDGTRSTVAIPSPLPPAAAPVDADTYEAIETLFDRTVVPIDDDEALAIAFLRAAFSLEAAADPDLARALGVLTDHDGLTVGERWRYEVATGAGVRVGGAAITVGSTPPLDPPTGLVAEPAPGGVGLRWIAADERTLVFGYRVEVGTAGGAFVDLGGGWLTPPVPDPAVPDPLWFVDDTPRAPGSQVAYRVVGRDLFGRETPPSEPVVLVVPDADAIPQAIVVDAESGDRSITLRWGLEHDPRVVAIGVLRAPSLDDAPQLVSPLLGPGADRWTDEGLRGGTDYYYAIAAFDRGGIASIGPLWAQRALNPNPPGAPGAVTATPRADGLALAWQPPAEDDIGRYQVFAGRPDAPFERMTLVAETTSTEVLVPVPANTLFDVALRVRAVNTSDVAGAPSTEAVGRPLDATPPSPPLWFDVRGAERAIALQWLRDLDPDVAYLQLSRSAEATIGPGGTVEVGAFETIADRLAPEATGFRDAEVVPGVVYAYRLVAVDASGNVSEPSELRTAAAWDLTAPTAPTGLRAEPLEGGVELAWEATAGVLGWYVERWRQGAWVEVSDLLDAPGFVDGRGEAGDRYRVRAVSPTGQVGEGAEVVVPNRD
jgi:hypothetical protein